ncbi:MAG TPA: hypothetical protein VE980_04500 [Pyrinomonadaceae bacterium]|nr:hypothetical protein [Pyrinomonadaceae bacterium]
MRTVRSSIVVLVSLTLAGVMYGQDTERKKPNKIREPNYRIGVKYRTVVSKARPIPPTLVLQVSVKPPDFSREAMILLARRLNRDFAKEERLGVLLFSDFEAARRFDPTRKGAVESLRGSYQLDRTTGKEELNIFLDPNEPQRNIKIDLTREGKPSLERLR